MPAAKKPRAKAQAKFDPVVEAMLADAARSGLSPDICAQLRFRPGDPSELEGLGLPAVMSYEIPYFDIKGEPTGFRRWRYLEDTRSGVAKKTDRKAIRYVQAGSTMPEIYLCPLLDWEAAAKDPSVPIVVTEGEKKAAAMCQAGVHCIGLGGVYSFKSARREVPFLQLLKAFAWKGRDVVVAYDSDAHTNPMVVMARNELCRVLLEKGAISRVADLPDADDGSKQGLDDLLVAKGPGAVEELLSSALTFPATQALHELSEVVAYVKNPGIIVELATGQRMRASDFTAHAYSNKHYMERTVLADGTEKMVRKKAAQSWLEWEQRLELRKMTYAPGQDRFVDGDYNTWSGWGCEPKKGSVKPWADLLDRLFDGHSEERRWFERWLALPLQRPGSKMFTSALLWGIGEGTGKSLVGKTMGRIYGENYALITDVELSDSTNAWAQNKQFVLGDDVTGHENRKHAERLKVIVTQESIRINEKYIPTFTAQDLINYLFTSNRPDAFFLDDNNRRNFIWEVACGPMTKDQVREYFDWLDGPGASALFDHLLRLDLGDMEAADPAMKTFSLDAMVDDSQSALGRWCRDLLREPDLMLYAGSAKLVGDLWSSQDLLRVYDPDEKKNVTASAISRELKRAGAKMAYKGQPLPTELGQRRLFVLRNQKEWLGARVKGPELAKHYAATRGSVKKAKHS